MALKTLLNYLALAAWLVAGAVAARAEYMPRQTPQLRVETGMHTAGIWRLDTSADGKLLVTGSDDKTVRLWSTEDGSLLRIFRLPIAPGSEGKVYSVAISPDGKLVAVGGWDAFYWANYWTTYSGHFVYLYDTVSGKLLKRLGPVPSGINDLDFSDDGRMLAAGLGNVGNGIRIWQAPFDTMPLYDLGYGEGVYNLDFGPGDLLAVTSDDGMVRLYGKEGGKDMHFISQAKAPSGNLPRGVAISPDGTKVAVAHLNVMAVDVLSVPDLKLIAQPDVSAYKNNDFTSVAWDTETGALYATGRYADADWDYPIAVWRDGKHELWKDAKDGPDAGISDISPMPGGRLAYSAQDPSFGIFDKSGKLILQRRPVIADMRNKNSGRFWMSPDASAVWFGLRLGNLDPWVFDLRKLNFSPVPEVPMEDIEPITTTLPGLQGWLDQTQPTLDGQVLDLGTQELSRSLAIAPDKLSFVLGADWSLTRYTAEGKRLWRNYPESVVWGVNLSAGGDIVVAALGDGTLRWYRMSDGVELLAFFVNAETRKWIAWTPKGYYACSPGGEDLIGWHVNGKDWDTLPDFFPASRLRDQYYRPDVVQQVLYFHDEEKAVNFANSLTKRKAELRPLNEVLPAVVEFAEDTLSIETTHRDIEVRYKLRSPSGRDITRLEVQIDGRPVTARAAVSLEDDDEPKVLPLSVPPRDSEVTLIAYIDEQASVPVTIPVKWKGDKVEGKKPRLFALMVGVSSYQDQSLSLRYAAKDARDIAEALKMQEGIFYEKVDVTMLLDGDATEDSIEEQLSKLRKKVLPDDIVIVFMAGHGFTDDAQDFFFLPTTVDMTPDRLPATAISGEVIRRGLSKIPGKVILFMDACHAGAGIQGGVGLVDMTGLANGLTDGASVVMFASSTGREVSYESPQWENGAFTEALLSIIADRRAYGDDGELSISELDEQLTTRVEELTDGKQTPVMTKPGAIKRFLIAGLD